MRAADMQLRAAYDDATAAGVSHAQLEAIRNRWMDVSTRFADDPAYQIAIYHTLAHSLTEMHRPSR